MKKYAEPATAMRLEHPPLITDAENCALSIWGYRRSDANLSVFKNLRLGTAGETTIPARYYL